ncbi:MAG TPA: hypothetical protein PLB52_00030 [Candidatus Moranbacteria bacterium]|nr:hypothetical protein [Candidatus Moranbacteria bacterium]
MVGKFLQFIRNIRCFKFNEFEVTKNNILFIILFLIIVVILLNFYSNSFILDSRHETLFSPLKQLSFIFNTWEGSTNFGESNLLSSAYILPYFLPRIFFTTLFGFNLGFFIFISLSFITSLFFFVKTIKKFFNYGNTKNEIYVLTLLGIVYLTSIYFSTSITAKYIAVVYPQWLLPVPLYFFLNLLKESNIKNVIKFSISTLFLSAVNLTAALIAIFCIGVVGLYYVIFFLKQKIDIKKILIAFSISIILNFFWLISYCIHFITINANKLSDIMVETPDMTNRISTYLNSFKGIGPWSFGIVWGPDWLSYAYQNFYLNEIIGSILLLPMMILLVSMFFKKRMNSFFFAGFIIILIPLMVGTREGIFAKIYENLFYSNSFFAIFRNSFKWYPMYHFLLIFAIINFLILIKKNFLCVRIIHFLLMLLLIVNIYPYISFKVIDEKSKISIPREYLNVNWENELGSDINKVFVLPKQYFEIFTWGKTNGNFSSIINKEVVISTPGPENVSKNKIYNKYYNLLVKKDIESFVKLTRDNNIKFILLRKDFDFVSYQDTSNSLKFNEELVSPFKKQMELRDWIIYKISDEVSPIIKTNNSIFQYNNSEKYIISINLQNKQSLIFLQNFHQEWNIYLEKNNSNGWCFESDKKIKYNNNITECQGFDKKFFEIKNLYYLWKKPIFNDTHKIINEYANKWTIDPEYIKQNFSKEYYRENPDGSIDVEMVLYFKPQSYFYLGLIISGTTLFGCLGYLLYDWRKRKKLIKKDGN